MTAYPWRNALRALQYRVRRCILLELLDVPPGGFVDLDSNIFDGEFERREFRVELRHRHLPLLEQLEYVCTADESTTVTTGAAYDEIRPFLELFDEHRSSLPTGMT